jgi:hypothetical protein
MLVGHFGPTFSLTLLPRSPRGRSHFSLCGSRVLHAERRSRPQAFVVIATLIDVELLAFEKRIASAFLDYPELEGVFAIFVPSILKVLAVVALLPQLTPMLMPTSREIQRAPDVALAVDQVDDLIDSGLSHAMLTPSGG